MVLSFGRLESRIPMHKAVSGEFVYLALHVHGQAGLADLRGRFLVVTVGYP